MIASPKLRVGHIAEFAFGDLIEFNVSDAENLNAPMVLKSFVGLICRYLHNDEPKKLVLVLGPIFPRGAAGRTLLDVGRDQFLEDSHIAISFGQHFAIKLPVDPNAWKDKEPEEECSAVLVTDGGLFFSAYDKLRGIPPERPSRPSICC